MNISKKKREAKLIGSNLPALSHSFGLTQQNIADATGISVHVIKKLEYDKEAIPENIAKILGFFGCSTVAQFSEKLEKLESMEKKTLQELEKLQLEEKRTYYMQLADGLGCPDVARFVSKKPMGWDPKTLGPAVCNLRESIGMEAATLAQKLDVSENFLKRFEDGQILLNSEAIKRLPKALGITSIGEILEAGTSIGHLDHKTFAEISRSKCQEKNLSNEDIIALVNVELGTRYPRSVITDMESDKSPVAVKKTIAQIFGFATPQAMVAAAAVHTQPDTSNDEEKARCTNWKNCLLQRSTTNTLSRR